MDAHGREEPALSGEDAAEALLESGGADVVQVALFGANADLVAVAGEGPDELLDLARRCASVLLAAPGAADGALHTVIEAPSGVVLLWVVSRSLAIAGTCGSGANVALARRVWEPHVLQVAARIEPDVLAPVRGRRHRTAQDSPGTTLAQQMIMDALLKGGRVG